MTSVYQQKQDPSGQFTEEPSPSPQLSVIRSIYDMMSQTPHAIAVTDGDSEWTYDDLRRHSDVVVRHLASHGVARGSVVGMHLPRSADAIASMIGIMAAGCVYLPLDTSYPAARLRLMLDRADALAVISARSDPDLYGAHRIWLPSPSQVPAATRPTSSEDSARSAEDDQVALEDYAYIIFTSGSTGDPKGVRVTHGNITLMVEWCVKVLGIGQFDASATTTSLSFDASFHETLPPLAVGGTVHVIPHALALGQLSRPVSFVACTCTLANELLRAGLLPSLKVLMVGGEVLAPDAAERLLSSGRVGRLLNCYGPTECTVCVTVAEVTIPVPEVIPIGRQVPGTEVLILGDDGQPLPNGQTGELFVFGGQVADGYVNDPAGSAERFTVRLDPEAGPRRCYRTGDLGYRLEDGNVYFSGRVDRQVKVNGHRIELGEVDAALRSNPQISEAATVVQDDDRLVSYVIPKHADSDVDMMDLKRHLSDNLPRFMLPAGIIALAEFPKTVSGKLDEAALPRWSPGRSGREPVAVDELTARVIEIVAKVTGFTGQIHLSDNFIDDLGGTSLGVVRVVVELERVSGKQIRMSDALADTSIAGLASLPRGGSSPSSADFAFNVDGSAAPLFLVHSYLGAMLKFRRLAELLPSDQPVYGLHVHSASEQITDDLTISSLGEDALRRMRAIQPAGSITLIGHSLGGLIAFEAARKSLAAGDPEPRILLMDSVAPRDNFDYYWGQLVLGWRDLIGERIAPHWKARRRTSPWTDASDDDDLMALAERYERYQKLTDVLIRCYRAEAYSGPMTVMRTRQGKIMALGRRGLGWSSIVAGPLQLIDMPGAHIGMLDAPYLDIAAANITDWLAGK